MKKVELKWNVLLNDFNSGKIVHYNALDDDYIIGAMRKLIKKGEILSKSDLKDFLERKLRARYMSRAEYEILVSGLFDKDNAEKIDVWQQLEMNLDNIVEYIIHKLNLDLKNK